MKYNEVREGGKCRKGGCRMDDVRRRKGWRKEVCRNRMHQKGMEGKEEKSKMKEGEKEGGM